MMKFPFYKKRDVLVAVAQHVQIVPVVEKILEYEKGFESYEDRFAKIVSGDYQEKQVWS